MNIRNTLFYILIVVLFVIGVIGACVITKYINDVSRAESVCNDLGYTKMKLDSETNMFYCYEYEETDGKIYRIKTKEYNINSIGENV